MAVNPASTAEHVAAHRAAVVAATPELSDWRDGSVNLSLAGAVAVGADLVDGVAARRFSEAYLETATGTALDRRIVDYGGPTRKPATPAVAPLTITRGAYVGAYTVTAGTQITGETLAGSRVTFTVDADIVLSAPSPSATGTATSDLDGAAFNVDSGTLTTLAGLPTGLTVAQTAKAAGGDDGEPYTAAGDALYLRRAQLLFRGNENGTLERYQATALGVGGVTYAQPVEILDADGNILYVAIYIGDPDAEATSGLLEDVEEAIEDTRIGGVEVRAFASEREELAFTYVVRVPAGTALTVSDFKDGLLAYFLTVAPGMVHEASQAEAFLHRRFDPLNERKVLSVDQTVPSARRTAPTNPYNAIRTDVDGSDITITLIEV